MRRWTLLYNFKNNLKFIFRTSNPNGLQGHHINGESWDDRLINMAIVHWKNHKTTNGSPIVHDPFVAVIHNQVPLFIKEGVLYTPHAVLERKTSSRKDTSKRIGRRKDPTSYSLR